MKVKLFVVGFFICMFFSILIQGFIMGLGNPHIGIIGYFGLLLFAWFNESFFMHVFLYGIYFLVVRLLIKNVERGWKLYASMVGFALVFLVTITINDWNLSQDSYKTFRDYITNGWHYPFYACVVIVIGTTMGLRALNAQGKESIAR